MANITALFPLSYPFWHTISPSISSRVQRGKFFGLSPSALLKAGVEQHHLDSPGLPPLQLFKEKLITNGNGENCYHSTDNFYLLSCYCIAKHILESE
uniref:Uncharacterized protein n=1 Tax=Cyanoderma ruficeps TaxID=181631 RepID=A0A8C3RAS7_9PASS